MTRLLSRRLSRPIGVFFAALCMLIHPAAALAQPESVTMSGRLATVEPANRRVTLIPDEQAELVEVFVAVEGQVAQAERPLTLTDLVLHVGRRITVTYRVDGSRRVADRIIVDEEQ